MFVKYANRIMVASLPYTCNKYLSLSLTNKSADFRSASAIGTGLVSLDQGHGSKLEVHNKKPEGSQFTRAIEWIIYGTYVWDFLTSHNSHMYRSFWQNLYSV
jgi:hypothetical protein